MHQPQGFISSLFCYQCRFRHPYITPSSKHHMAIANAIKAENWGFSYFRHWYYVSIFNDPFLTSGLKCLQVNTDANAAI